MSGRRPLEEERAVPQPWTVISPASLISFPHSYTFFFIPSRCYLAVLSGHFPWVLPHFILISPPIHCCAHLPKENKVVLRRHLLRSFLVVFHMHDPLVRPPRRGSGDSGSRSRKRRRSRRRSSSVRGCREKCDEEERVVKSRKLDMGDWRGHEKKKTRLADNDFWKGNSRKYKIQPHLYAYYTTVTHVWTQRCTLDSILLFSL